MNKIKFDIKKTIIQKKIVAYETNEIVKVEINFTDTKKVIIFNLKELNDLKEFKKKINANNMEFNNFTHTNLLDLKLKTFNHSQIENIYYEVPTLGYIEYKDLILLNDSYNIYQLQDFLEADGDEIKTVKKFVILKNYIPQQTNKNLINLETIFIKDYKQEQETLSKFKENILNLFEPETRAVFIASIMYIFTSYFFTKLNFKTPILNIVGIKGAGKSSTLEKIISRLGLQKTPLINNFMQTSPAAFKDLLTTSTIHPVILDEFTYDKQVSNKFNEFEEATKAAYDKNYKTVKNYSKQYINPLYTSGELDLKKNSTLDRLNYINLKKITPTQTKSFKNLTDAQEFLFEVSKILLIRLLKINNVTEVIKKLYTNCEYNFKDNQKVKQLEPRQQHNLYCNIVNIKLFLKLTDYIIDETTDNILTNEIIDNTFDFLVNNKEQQAPLFIKMLQEIDIYLQSEWEYYKTQGKDLNDNPDFFYDKNDESLNIYTSAQSILYNKVRKNHNLKMTLKTLDKELKNIEISKKSGMSKKKNNRRCWVWNVKKINELLTFYNMEFEFFDNILTGATEDLPFK